MFPWLCALYTGLVDFFFEGENCTLYIMKTLSLYIYSHFFKFIFSIHSQNYSVFFYWTS